MITKDILPKVEVYGPSEGKVKYFDRACKVKGQIEVQLLMFVIQGLCEV